MVGSTCFKHTVEHINRRKIAGRLLGDDWENTCCIITPNTNKTSTQHKPIQYTLKTKPDGWVVGSGHFKQIWCESKSPEGGREIAGRWLGGSPWLFPKIAGVILDRCKLAGR